MHLQLIGGHARAAEQILPLPEQVVAVAHKTKQQHVEKPLLPKRPPIGARQLLLIADDRCPCKHDGRYNAGQYRNDDGRRTVQQRFRRDADRHGLAVDEREKTAGGADALGHQPAEQRSKKQSGCAEKQSFQQIDPYNLPCAAAPAANDRDYGSLPVERLPRVHDDVIEHHGDHGRRQREQQDLQLQALHFKFLQQRDERDVHSRVFEHLEQRDVKTLQLPLQTRQLARLDVA